MKENDKIKMDKKDFAASDGCWVIIYEDEGYEDASLLVNGPSSHSNMRGLPNSNGKDWGDDVDSIVVGPNCWLQVFADEGFSDTMAWYGPGTHAPGLGDMGDEIDSMILHDHPPAGYLAFLRREYKASKM